ncbi:MAG: hypothetical protein M3Z37_04955 [Candidatus Eremiobacteraeota bacterium]|nr:hypothetical protein [Candidatus Eremiobacteraeota bacterium]
MRSVWTARGVSLAVLATATFEQLRPYTAAVHSWGYSLLIALAGLSLAYLVAQFLGRRPPGWRAASLAALGGIVIAAAFTGAELLAGPPQRVTAAPGQTFMPPRSANVTLAFPPLGPDTLSAQSTLPEVVLTDTHGATRMHPGTTYRFHSYVFRCQAGPAAYITARSPRQQPETVTQPNGVAFVSPVLQFQSVDADGLPLDEFAVPALHRSVAVKYYPGLPSRSIDIPFLQLQIKEENGGPLYDGVAVSGRALEKAGLWLRFSLGKYPQVTMTSAPDPMLFFVGAVLVLLGSFASILSLWQTRG